MTEEKICPIMSRPKGWYPAVSKTVRVCHHCDQLMSVETSAGVKPHVWHDEYPCQKDKCMAWTTYQLDSPENDGKDYGYCKLIGNE